MSGRYTITYWAPQPQSAVGVSAPVVSQGQIYGDALEDVDEVYFDYGVDVLIEAGGYLALGEHKHTKPYDMDDARRITGVSLVPCMRTLGQQQVAILN